jgi:uncharacterized protein YbjQ (UPF0145 family)
MQEGGHMLIITTENPGRDFKPVCAIIEHGVVGLNVLKDFFAGIADITGGHVSTYEKTAKDVIQGLVDKMVKSAEKNNADAIIGLTPIVMPMASKNTSMYSITVSGTAIKYVDEKSSMQGHDVHKSSSGLFAETKKDNNSTTREHKSTPPRRVVYNRPRDY